MTEKTEFQKTLEKALKRAKSEIVQPTEREVKRIQKCIIENPCKKALLNNYEEQLKSAKAIQAGLKRAIAEYKKFIKS